MDPQALLRVEAALDECAAAMVALEMPGEHPEIAAVAQRVFRAEFVMAAQDMAQMVAMDAFKAMAR